MFTCMLISLTIENLKLNTNLLIITGIWSIRVYAKWFQSYLFP